MRLFSPLRPARTLATRSIVQRGALLGMLALMQRVLTPATAWVLFAQPMALKLAVGFALGAVFTVRTYLQLALSARTEADLFERVTVGALDGDVLRVNVLPTEEAQAELGQGVFIVAQQLSEVGPCLVADLIAAALLGIVVATVEPVRLVVGATALTLFAAVVLMLSRGYLQRAARVAWDLRDRLLDKMVDAFGGRLEIVASAGRAAFAAETRRRASAWGTASAKVAGHSAMSGKVPLLIIAATVAVVVTADARWRGAFSVTVADIALFATVTPAFAGIAQGILAIVQMEHWTKMVADVIEKAGPDRGGAVPPAPFEPIAFDRVSFRYPGTNSEVLKEAAFAWREERVIALCGPNGSGKSTCLRLLLALGQPRTGAVRVGGAELAVLDADAWRRHIAYLSQRPYFPVRADVRTAVRLLAPDAPDARIMAALQRVDVLEALRCAGSDPLGVRVDTLSVGQRQRIALARMLCREASLFVLDEPDANLDRAGIALVIELVGELSKGHRVILAAHTPDLLALAERVIELDQGRVVRDEPKRPAASARLEP